MDMLEPLTLSQYAVKIVRGPGYYLDSSCVNVCIMDLKFNIMQNKIMYTLSSCLSLDVPVRKFVIYCLVLNWWFNYATYAYE